MPDHWSLVSCLAMGRTRSEKLGQAVWDYWHRCTAVGKWQTGADRLGREGPRAGGWRLAGPLLLFSCRPVLCGSENPEKRHSTKRACTAFRLHSDPAYSACRDAAFFLPWLERTMASTSHTTVREIGYGYILFVLGELDWTYIIIIIIKLFCSFSPSG